jgi:hypothetical protein
MNPDNPNFRTPEEEARAAELVRLKAEVERQARVIEKLREQRNYYCDMAQMPDKSYQEHLEECDAEIDAIEKGKRD